MKLLLFDTPLRKRLFPLTSTRAVADLRCGILTIKEWWQFKTGLEVFIFTDTFLQGLYPPASTGDYLIVDASVLPDASLYNKIVSLQTNEALVDDSGLIAGRTYLDDFPSFNEGFTTLFQKPISANTNRLDSLPQIFQLNAEAITDHFDLITAGRKSQPIATSNQVVNPDAIFIEPGASVECSFINASTGPVYIGKNAMVMEGCMIRGPFALCEGAVLKMGTKIYGATTLGPYCVGGGEIKNSVIIGYSNKAHDGYLGDSVVGEWCNFGAGTSNSNLKNSAGEVKVWNYLTKHYEPSGTKCGVLMGDYSRTAINSSINTGTVIGVCCNVFGEGLTPKFIPDFSWGATGANLYKFEKAVNEIGNWKQMKNKTLEENQIMVLKHIFER